MKTPLTILLLTFIVVTVAYGYTNTMTALLLSQQKYNRSVHPHSSFRKYDTYQKKTATVGVKTNKPLVENYDVQGVRFFYKNGVFTISLTVKQK